MQQQVMDMTLLTVAETAAKLGMNDWTIRSWIQSGKLASVKLGKQRKSAVRVPSTEVSRLILEGMRPAVKPITRKK